VVALNSFGPSASSAASNSITPAIPVIGSVFGGGYFAGQISTAATGVADYNLVVGPLSSAQSASLRWKTVNTTTAGTTSQIDGNINSANMNNATHPAAQFCEAVSAGGFTDWYMPAKNELEVCYYNLKPTTQDNYTISGGTNPNAVPPRVSNYTTGTPAQTLAAIFQSAGSEAFTAGGYWSSTQKNTANAYKQYFTMGLQADSNKDGNFAVRAIRRVAV
jgi:hypothetical protein